MTVPRPAALRATGWMVRKAAGAALVLFAVASITFVAIRLLPGDPIRTLIAGGAAPSPETVAAVRARYDLDQPFVVQYVRYFARALHGDLGDSIAYQRPVSSIFADGIGPTLQLGVAALALAWAIAVVSVLATAHRSRWLSQLGSSIETFFAAVPDFWLGIMLLLAFAVTLGWFPVLGDSSQRALVLPALTLALPMAGSLAQSMRESFEIVAEQPFVDSARARGISERRVRLRHVMRHALLPPLTMTAALAGYVFSGAIVVEMIFSRPGLGRYMQKAVLAQDLNLVAAITVFIGVVYVLTNLVVDLVVTFVDPRLRVARFAAPRRVRRTRRA